MFTISWRRTGAIDGQVIWDKTTPVSTPKEESEERRKFLHRGRDGAAATKNLH